MLPQDPHILLSYLNTELRDVYEDLSDLCAAMDIEDNDLTEKLACAGYRYDPIIRQFISRKETPMKNDCLFCAIAAGEIPSNKVYEDELCFAFYDIAPQAPVHFLVIPKEHIASVAEITGENSGLVAHIFEVIANVSRELGLESYRVVSNIGRQAGQSVRHLHFHVLSGRDMTWPPG